MVGRRTRVGLGCGVVAALGVAAGVFALGSAPAAASGGAGGVKTVSAATWNAAASVHSAADLARVSSAARSLVVTPSIEIAQVRRTVPGTTQPYVPGRGPRCADVTLTTVRRNVFGAVLMTAKTTVRNWCFNGTTVTSEPTVQRSTSATMGWSTCGWDDDYAGWLQARSRFGAGGDARFALGRSCAGASAQLHNDVEVQGDGHYSWAY